MCAKLYHNVFRRAAACAATLAAITALQVSSAQAGGVYTTDCLQTYGGGHAFGYNRGFSIGYGSGYINGSGSGYGSGNWGGYGQGGCVHIERDGLANPYVISVPPVSDQDRTDAANRDRLWQSRCRPVIRQDAYGVPRYQYAAPGCEYGKYE
jgi:hypothetical protein